MLNVVDNRLVEMTTLGTELLGKGMGGLPLGRLAGCRLIKHLVNLLESKTLGFGDEEVGVDEGTCAKTSPNEEHLGLEVALVLSDHVRGNNGDDCVPEPVGGS